MPATPVQTAGGPLVAPRAVARLLRDHAWAITPRQRRALRREMLRISRESLSESSRIGAARVLLQMDALDARRERAGDAARQADALLSLEAVRTQLAAQLAAGRAGLVIPSLPAPIAQDAAPSDPAGQARPIPLATADAPQATLCDTCQDSGYCTTSSGALPCPRCTTDLPPAERPPPVQVRRAVRLADAQVGDGQRYRPDAADGPPADPADLAY